MARIKIGNVRQPPEELLAYFAPSDYVDSQCTVSAAGELDAFLKKAYNSMENHTQKNVCALLSLTDGLPGGAWFIAIRRSEVNFGHLEAVQYTPNGASPGVCRRTIYAGEWGEWAFANPPMDSGKEYLTTERRFNKPVYTALINIGSMPNATIKSVDHGLDVLIPIRCTGNCGNVSTIPCKHGNLETWVSFDTEKIYVYSATDLSSNTAYVQLWYTKT